MWIRFLLQDAPYQKGDEIDWTPDESARRLIAEGKAEAMNGKAAEKEVSKEKAPPAGRRDKMARPNRTK